MYIQHLTNGRTNEKRLPLSPPIPTKAHPTNLLPPQPDNCDTGTFDSCNSDMGSCIASTCDQRYPSVAQAAQWAACRISGASYAFAVRAFAGDAFYASNSARCTCHCGDTSTSLCSASASGTALQCVNVALGLDANNCGGCGRKVSANS